MNCHGTSYLVITRELNRPEVGLQMKCCHCIQPRKANQQTGFGWSGKSVAWNACIWHEQLITWGVNHQEAWKILHIVLLAHWLYAQLNGAARHKCGCNLVGWPPHFILGVGLLPDVAQQLAFACRQMRIVYLTLVVFNCGRCVGSKS